MKNQSFSKCNYVFYQYIFFSDYLFSGQNLKTEASRISYAQN